MFLSFRLKIVVSTFLAVRDRVRTPIHSTRPQQARTSHRKGISIRQKVIRIKTSEAKCPDEYFIIIQNIQPIILRMVITGVPCFTPPPSISLMVFSDPILPKNCILLYFSKHRMMWIQLSVIQKKFSGAGTSARLVVLKVVVRFTFSRPEAFFKRWASTIAHCDTSSASLTNGHKGRKETSHQKCNQ
jgi:hypothetical protein